MDNFQFFRLSQELRQIAADVKNAKHQLLTSLQKEKIIEEVTEKVVEICQQLRFGRVRGRVEDFYKVDLDKFTCTCPHFQARLSSYSKEDLLSGNIAWELRYSGVQGCKHLKRARREKKHFYNHFYDLTPGEVLQTMH